MLSFQNTEIAFQSKSEYQLLRSYLLFKLISKPGLVKITNRILAFALRIHFPIKWIVKPSVYAHFVGGENIADCHQAVRTLEKYGVKAILDYSVEGKESEADIQNALEETLRSIQNAAQDSNIPFAVFKPTAFTSHQVLELMSSGKDVPANISEEGDKFRQRVNTLCQAAYQAGIPILIDAEDSWFQAFIDQVVEEMMVKYNQKKAIVFNTLQMYRHDRLAFLETSYQKALKGNYFLGIKFVRGAYMEKERERAKEKGYPDPIQPDKESTDRDYNAGLAFCMEHLDRISIFNGSHNEYSNAYLAQLMEEKNIAKNDERIWFSQLYGMSDHISFNLANMGYNIAKYLPYGPVKHVMPYLFRRAEENTSVAGQTGRELSLLIVERKRRKGRI